MQSELTRLIQKINDAPVDYIPSDNFYIENVFSEEMYQNILKYLPDDNDYDFIEHPDAVLPDGKKTRMLLDMTDETISRLQPEMKKFWHDFNTILTSPALLNAITTKFAERIKERFGDNWPEMVNVPILYRDFTGYYISVHPDAPWKIATLQFYLPKDESQIHLGTSFHLKMGDSFPIIKTNQFKPNSAYAFARTDNSWHSVQPITDDNIVRNTLALTVYIKGQQYKSSPKEYK